MSDDFIRDFGAALDRAAASVARGQAPSHRRRVARSSLVLVTGALAALVIVTLVIRSSGAGTSRDERPAGTPEQTDKPPTQGLAEVPPPPEGLANVSLPVANGAYSMRGGVADGLATKYGERLTAAGWSVAGITNTAMPDVKASVVVYKGDRRGTAEQVGLALGLPVERAEADSFDDELFTSVPSDGIGIVLGEDAVDIADDAKPVAAPAHFSDLPSDWTQSDSGDVPITAHPGAKTWTVATSWPYVPNDRGPASVLPDGEFFIQVLLLRSQLQDTAKSNLCSGVAASDHFPAFDLRNGADDLLISFRNAEKVHTGSNGLPEYRLEGSLDDEYYVDLRMVVSSFPASDILLEQADSALRKLNFPDWPDYC